MSTAPLITRRDSETFAGCFVLSTATRVGDDNVVTELVTDPRSQSASDARAELLANHADRLAKAERRRSR